MICSIVFRAIQAIGTISENQTNRTIRAIKEYDPVGFTEPMRDACFACFFIDKM